MRSECVCDLGFVVVKRNNHMCFLWLHVVPERYPHAINQTLGTANGRTQPRIIARRRTLPSAISCAICVRA